MQLVEDGYEPTMVPWIEECTLYKFISNIKVK